MEKEEVRKSIRQKWEKYDIEKLKEFGYDRLLSAFKYEAMTECELCKFIAKKKDIDIKDELICEFCPANRDNICYMYLDTDINNLLLDNMAVALRKENFDKYEELRKELLEWIEEVDIEVVEDE